MGFARYYIILIFRMKGNEYEEPEGDEEEEEGDTGRGRGGRGRGGRGRGGRGRGQGQGRGWGRGRGSEQPGQEGTKWVPKAKTEGGEEEHKRGGWGRRKYELLPEDAKREVVPYFYAEMEATKQQTLVKDLGAVVDASLKDGLTPARKTQLAQLLSGNGSKLPKSHVQLVEQQ